MTLAMILRSAATALLLGWPPAVPALHTLEPAADTAAAVLLREAPPPRRVDAARGSGPRTSCVLDPSPAAVVRRPPGRRSALVGRDGSSPGTGDRPLRGHRGNRLNPDLGPPRRDAEPLRTDPDGPRGRGSGPGRRSTRDRGPAAAHCELYLCPLGCASPRRLGGRRDRAGPLHRPCPAAGWSGPSVLRPLEGTLVAGMSQLARQFPLRARRAAMSPASLDQGAGRGVPAEGCGSVRATGTPPQTRRDPPELPTRSGQTTAARSSSATKRAAFSIGPPISRKIPGRRAPRGAREDASATGSP